MVDRLTAQETARALGVTVRTVWRMAEAGKIEEAPRTGNARMFWRRSVEALRAERGGGELAEDVTMEDAYARLAACESWEDVQSLKADMRATILSRASLYDGGRELLTESWRAACAMAATAKTKANREAWRAKAHEYGAYLGKRRRDTDMGIERRAGMSRDAVKRLVEAAPADPAMAIAARGRAF